MAHKPKSHLSKPAKARIAAKLRHYYKTHPGAAHKAAVKAAHTAARTRARDAKLKAEGKPIPTKAGELGMCAFTAAGLITGGCALEAFMDYGAPSGGATIPEALTFMGAKPIGAARLSAGTALALRGQRANHAVVVDELDEHGAWVWSWNELHFLTWDYINAHGEDAWIT